MVHLLFVISREDLAVFACMCVLKRDAIGGERQREGGREGGGKRGREKRRDVGGGRRGWRERACERAEAIKNMISTYSVE